MATRLVNLVVDAADPRRLGTFWAGLLDSVHAGWRVAIAIPEEVDVRAPAGDGWDLDLGFVPVPDRKLGQNRLHLDLASASDQERADTVARARELGADPIDIGQHVDGGVPWVVLADPEGNEFCVREPKPAYAETGAVAGVLIDAVDPDRLAAFWAEAAGWPITPSDEGCVALRAPAGGGPWVEFWGVERPKPATYKNRLHFDVAPPLGGDHRAEADRLIDLGARPIDVGQGADSAVPWVVLADPEGNEFCVLTPREHPPQDYYDA